MHAGIEKLLATPRNEWEDLSPDELFSPGYTGTDPVREAEGHAESLVRAAEYLYNRTYGQSHAEAMRSAERKAKAMRRALGYTYP